MTESFYEPLIISVAPTGGRRTKQDHPSIPLTIDEIAGASEACVEAGAALIHLHVRDRRQRHVLDVGLYNEAIEKIRARVGPDPIIQVTTEAGDRYSREEQMQVVRKVRPEAVSLSIMEIAGPRDDRHMVAAFYQWMSEEGIAVQHIITGHTQDIPDPQSRRADQVTLNSYPVSIPAGNLEYRFKICMGKQSAHCYRRHMTICPRSIRDIHAVRKSLQSLSRIANLLRVCAVWRV